MSHFHQSLDSMTPGGMPLSRDELITVIETHTKNVRFCILCNYVNKITPAIQSRCTRFRFSPLPEKEVQIKVDQVIEQEGWVLSFFFFILIISYILLHLQPVPLLPTLEDCEKKRSKSDR